MSSAREIADGRLEPSRVVSASFGQASLWFLRQVMPYPSAYNTAVQFRISGRLDAGALTAAIREVVRRHESLRTTFRSADGAVVQVISESLLADVATIDLSGSPDPEAAGARLGLDLAAAPFDLEQGPLLRARLLRFGPTDHALVAVVDHIVADGMSLAILWRELEALYGAFQAGEPSPLPPPSRQFADCVDAQRGWLTTPAFTKQLRYWTSHLAGATAPELPADRPRPAIRSYRGGLATKNVPASLVTRLREACVQDDVSLFAAMLAGLDVVLARSCGERDVVVMVPMAGRQRLGGDGVVGYFANLALLRTEVPGDLS
ncbi:MAG TPA: condensation domain-containing protein, partial [Polyangiaceae bacterium]|nr:condensation domain-containing protein [Polyangiaceae bacterium]